MGTIGLVATGYFSSRAPAPALPTANSPKADSSTIELLIATRLWNTTEPCGCTSTPLGDVARIAALLKSSPDRSLLLDAGGLRYEPKVLSASKLPQARLKADFIEKTWQELSAVVMVQSEDLRGEQGLAELTATKRLVANLRGLPAGTTTPREVRTLLGVKMGIVGITDPSGPWPAGVQVSDPETALGEQLAALRGEGVESVIVLTGMPREKTRRLARKFPDVKLWVAGANDKVEEGVELPEILGGALLVTPGYKGERLFHISLHPSATGSLVWRFVATPQQRQRQLSVLRERVALPYRGHFDPSTQHVFTREHPLEGMRSVLCVPLVARDHALGTLTLAARRPRVFAGGAAQLLGVLASGAGILSSHAETRHAVESAAPLRLPLRKAAKYTPGAQLFPQWTAPDFAASRSLYMICPSRFLTSSTGIPAAVSQE